MPIRPQPPTVGSIAFNNSLIASFLFEGQDLDCPNMTLTCASGSEQAIYSGPGLLRCDADGGLYFKLYPDQSANPGGLVEWNRTALPGQLINRRFFHTLRATDYAGNEWTSEGILPQLTQGPSGFSIHAPLHDLRAATTMGIALKGSCLRMLFLDDVEIPCNATTDTTINFGEGPVFTSRLLNVAKFTSLGFDFVLNSESGLLAATVNSSEPFPPNFPMRVLEALQFVLAKSLYVRFLEEISGSTSTIRLLPAPPKSHHTTMLLPLNLHTIEAHRTPNPIWMMFDKYLRFILPFGGPDWHACSIYVHKAREASANSLDAHALGLTVAIEGLAKLLYPDLGKPRSNFKEAVRDLKAYCQRWPGMPDWDGNASLKDRTDRLLGNLCGVRASDRLYRLSENGTVQKTLVEAWKALRDPMAHAELPDAAEHQRFVDNLMSATVLLHQLIFSAIGYAGPYSDYSTPGFPVVAYPPSTQESSTR